MTALQASHDDALAVREAAVAEHRAAQQLLQRDADQLRRDVGCLRGKLQQSQRDCADDHEAVLLKVSVVGERAAVRATVLSSVSAFEERIGCERGADEL